MRFLFGLLLLGLASCKREAESRAPAATSEALAREPEPAPPPASPLRTGDTVADFQALAHTGQLFRISEFLARPALVYFCVSDRAPACRDFALVLRDQWLLLNPSLSMVFGVTPEDSFVHADFAGEAEISHLLVADPQGKVHQSFGLSPGVDAAYLLGPDRKVLATWSPVPSSGFVEQVLGVLRPLGLVRPVPPI